MRAVAAISNGVFFVKLAAWTAFALGGPLCFLGMRNYLGMTVTGAIGVLIGLALPQPEKKLRSILALRVALVLQGIGLGGYGAYMLSRPPDPWVFAIGRTRTALALASSGKVYALEFSEHNAGFFVRDESGSWTRSNFPGYLASDIALGPRQDVVYAREDRADVMWTLGPDNQWERRDGFGFRSSLATSDRALFITSKGSLFRVDGPEAPMRRVTGVGTASVLCARGRYVLAVLPKTQEVGKVWQSEDGGISFVEVLGASIPASVCGISDDGTRWVVAEGTFSGVLSIATLGSARFDVKNVPAPRVEAIAVNPKNGDEAWIGVWGAGVYRSLDGGDSWSQMGLTGYEVSALGVDFANHRAYAGTGSGVYELSF